MFGWFKKQHKRKEQGRMVDAEKSAPRPPAANMAERVKQLEAEGGLPVDDLPRTEGGRVDRDAADAQFAEVQQIAQADPNDWRAWFRVAASYDAAEDRKRARAAMYHAVDLFVASPEGGKKS